MGKIDVKIAAASFWHANGTSSQFLAHFWIVLWEKEQARKVTSFHWLLVHRALPVKEWLHRPNMDSLFVSCQLASKTIRHCIWDCHLAIQVWLCVSRLLQKQDWKGYLTWGSEVWTSFVPYVAKYDCNVGTTKVISIVVETINRVPMMEVRPNKANTRQMA